MEQAKMISGVYAATRFLTDKEKPLKVGIGSGSTIVYCVSKIAELFHNKKVDVLCFPTSFQSKQLILENNLPISDIDVCLDLDIVIDGVDEIDSELNAIKGGGGCLFKEKLIASCSTTVVAIADSSSEYLGEKWKKGIPLEVFPLAYKLVIKKLEELKLKPILRMAIQKAGPVITDNGNFIIDAQFDEKIVDLKKLDQDIHMIPGVIETGLFLNIFDYIVYGEPDGTVIEIDSVTKQVKSIKVENSLVEKMCKNELIKNIFTKS